MDEYENKIIELTYKLTQKETGNIKSVIGVMDLIYSLSEEVTSRDKKLKFSNEFKKTLSVRVIVSVSDILFQNSLISEELFTYIKETVDNQNISLFIEFLEDINEIWIQNISKHCLCFSRNNNKDKIKRFKKLR